VIQSACPGLESIVQATCGMSFSHASIIGCFDASDVESFSLSWRQGVIPLRSLSLGGPENSSTQSGTKSLAAWTFATATFGVSRRPACGKASVTVYSNSRSVSLIRKVQSSRKRRCGALVLPGNCTAIRGRQERQTLS
jgi:hypothetical protein